MKIPLDGKALNAHIVTHPFHGRRVTVTDTEIKNRFNVLTWAVGAVAALVVATLGMVVTMSYQLGQINGELGVLINHVALK
jgi:hypothetical protein